MRSDEWERKEQTQRSRAWYAILGLAALVAGAIFILRWIPDNPFHAPSELPNMSRYNAEDLTGRGGPLLPLTPGAAGALGPGCRASDVALVQERRGALHRTTVEALLAREDRARRRRQRFDVGGWTARAPDAGDGCVVEFAWREGRTPHRATWLVEGDRHGVRPLDDEARALER